MIHRFYTNLKDFEARLKVPNDVEDYGFISEDTKKRQWNWKCISGMYSSLGNLT